jgi:hypothetical protein
LEWSEGMVYEQPSPVPVWRDWYTSNRDAVHVTKSIGGRCLWVVDEDKVREAGRQREGATNF